jgi:hypothetical protein
MSRGGVRAIAAVAACLCAPALGAGTAAAHARWSPPAHLTWYWQLQGRVHIENVQVSDIDGFDNGAAEVARLHALGQHVVCYVDVGSWERWRPDAARFPLSVRGRTNGWPGERWLDVRRLSVLEPIMRARFAMCARKGFDAVEPDNMDGFENPTGFHISAAQQLSYDRWVARAVHRLGMAVFEKNDPEQAAKLEPSFDGVLDEQCNQYHECGAFRAYLRAGKPVLNAEYKRALYPGFCGNDQRLGISGALYALELNGTRFEPCGVNQDSLRL